MERSSGILMPLFSLPSPGGIGTAGRAAYDFIDFLAAAGQHWWQMLPVGPAGCGDSPYQSFSAFAGSPDYIDLELLVSDGLLTAAELSAADLGSASAVDYAALRRTKLPLLRTAAARGLPRDGAALEAFAGSHPWLPDYALFTALREHFDGAPLTAWPEDIRLRRADALARYGALLAEEVRFHAYLQLLFHRQWQALRAYARSRGVGLIGDLPIYVSPDAADVWAEPRFFRLDGRGFPDAVAGVPPDAFSDEGQLWGNPLYDWDAMARDGFGWWIRRVGGAAELFDAVRIDHFRGFESYWAVPAGAESAKEGHWEKGPGMALIGVLNGWFPGVPFIAEDLGTGTEAVTELLAASGWPGMRVLQFAFDPAGTSCYLPHAHVRNCVCYTGTHDNDTLEGWRQSASPAERAFALRYLGADDAAKLREAVLRAGLGSVADLFIAPLQDWLGLGVQARINAPGTPAGNWRWRLPPGALTDPLAARIAALTALYGRG